MIKRGINHKQEPYNGIQFVVDEATRNELKPLVFFDAGKFSREDDGFTINFHPHSGIGIITFMHGTDLHHRDSGNHDGVVPSGGVQWMKAGKGIWHQEGYRRELKGPETGPWTGSIHQLWIQLPPQEEESEVSYVSTKREDIPQVDNVNIITGQYKGLSGAFETPINMTYLDVSLDKDESWSFKTPENQTTGFMFVRDGKLDVYNTSLKSGEMGVMDHNDGEIQVIAQERSSFVVVLAEPSQWPIYTHGGQVHTNQDSLERSIRHISNIKKTLVY